MKEDWTKRAVGVVIAGTLFSCAAPTPRQPHEARRQERALIRQAAVIDAHATDHMRDIRGALLAAVGTNERVSLLIDGQPRIVVETAGSHGLDDLTTMVDVQVAANGVRVGSSPAAATTGVEGAARAVATSPTTAFLVRGEQDALVEDVIATLEALGRAGATHVVLGGTTIEAPLPSWDDCPFPEGRSGDDAKVGMRIEFDEGMRAAAIQVLNAPPPGFGAAAAFCVARHRYTVRNPDVRGKSYTLMMHFH